MTVQFRLTIVFIGVILVTGLAMAVVTAYHIANVLLDEVQARVSLNLKSAQTVYDGYVDHVGLFLRGAALDPTLPDLMAGGPPAEARLKLMRRTGGADRLYLLDMQGKVVASTAGSGANGQDYSAIPIISKALQRRSPITGTVLVPKEALENPAEADEEEPKEPGPKDIGGKQLALAAAVPIRNAAGEAVGFLYGMDVLNDDNGLVDAIRSEVFKYTFYKDSFVGTATVFQGDLRICTNVPSGDGRRALGTPMTPEVRKAVLNEGREFTGTSYEVNDEYFTAYEPIRDPDGAVVGALCVGVLRAPFVASRNTTIGILLVIVSAIATLILLLLIIATRQVLRPIDRVVAMTGRVAGGDLSARVGIRPAGELGQLCAAVDRMADAVAEREAQLELATRRQISQSEKLASIGRLAAGVAHEVNNPLTGVLTFTHLLLHKPNLDDQDRADLDLVIRETTRVRDIVRGLLDFARERPTRRQCLDVNEVLRQSTRLLRGQKEFGGIVIEERLAETLPQVQGDPNQLQQVFLNLSLNACESMPRGGLLVITTETREGEVAVSFSDTGAGIRQEDLERIFEPFFTTKPVGEGTGLGLSVTYGIVKQHGGTLGVKSAIGKGTTFTVTLPIELKEDGGADHPTAASENTDALE
jgi:two-component system, NtrC family, sensor kinase